MEYFSNALTLFNTGGLVMYPLLFCSVAAVAIVIERHLYLRSFKTDISALLPQIEADLKNNNWNAALKTSENFKGAAALMLSSVLKNPPADSRYLRELFETVASRLTAKLRHRVVYLETIVTLAPLLGLLGTVNGMIRSFSILNINSGQPLAITGGIGEALVATAAGLCVAIIALVFHSYLNNFIEKIISDMEEAANTVITVTINKGVEKNET
jgi:biopolymer transport protein ExbB